MRKLLIAILLPAVLASCDKISQPTSREIVLAPSIICMETRGYVEGPTLHDSDEGAERVIYLSAYDVTDSKNYFTGNTFTKSGDVWHSSSHPVYWYRDNRLNVLAVSISSSNPTISWDKSNVSSGVAISMNNTSIKDDILYATAKNCIPEEGSSINLCFNHTQAFVKFNINNQLGNKLTVKNITIKNAICSGVININNAGSSPICSWDTSGSVPSDCVLPITDNTAYALLPQQARPSTIVADIIYDGESKKAQLTNDNTYWLSARQYIYTVTFKDDWATKSAGDSDLKIELSEEVLPW